MHQSKEKHTKPSELPIDQSLSVGIDAGGTKVHITDSQTSRMNRYNTGDYPDMYTLLEMYFAEIGRQPAQVVLAIAGPRDDETGDIQMSNARWFFSPNEAAKRFPGTKFETINDMIGAAAGAFSETGTELEQLLPGTPSATGTKIVVAASTGIGVAAAIWDKQTGKFVFMATEGGHIGFQPKNADEREYLDYLQGRSTAKYRHVSVEIALSGKYGIDSLVDHELQKTSAKALEEAVARARAGGRPVGAVLREFAEEGSGTDQRVARSTLYHLGNMLGSVLRDYAVVFKATGGIYLIGSVNLALAEYFVQHTDFADRFVHPGATHDTWIGKIPVYLVTDPHVAVKGSLALAEQAPR